MLITEQAFDGFTTGLEKELSNYGKKTSAEATKCVALVDGYCDSLGSTATDRKLTAPNLRQGKTDSFTVSAAVDKRASAQRDASQSMSTQVEETHNQSLARTENVASAIEQLSSSISQSVSLPKLHVHPEPSPNAPSFTLMTRSTPHLAPHLIKPTIPPARPSTRLSREPPHSSRLGFTKMSRRA